MAPYFDLTVGPPPTERLSNAIESERDLRHGYARYGSTDNSWMRWHKCPDSIPRYNHNAIDQFGQQLHEHIVFYGDDHKFIRRRWIFYVHRIWICGIRKHDPNANFSEQQRKRSSATCRRDRDVEHSKSSRLADLRRVRQRWRWRSSASLWIHPGSFDSKHER